MGLQEEIQEIEEEIENTPYNKSTEKHIGRLKAKLSKLKDELAQRESGSGGGGGYNIPKTGDARVVLVGFPSVGKSTLINQITNAESETGSYGFTTLEVVPGMLKYRNTDIQILDVPGLIEGASEGRGGGKEILSVVRSADLLVFMVDVFEPEQYKTLHDELYEHGIRIDASPPRVKINRKDRGGIDVRKFDDVEIDDELVESVCEQHGIVNASVVIREDVTVDELNDAILDNRVYVDSAVTVNKMDLADPSTVERTREKLSEYGVEDAVGISAKEGKGLDAFKEMVFESLDLIRVYMKPQGGDPDYDEPMVVREGATVGDLASKIHGEAEERFRYAKVWGDSAKHDGQQVGEDHVLSDEDVLSVIMKK
ncbi:OBG GTPase family GTP-binding protein [Halorutilales archaeon Cl-col2-1]